MIKAILFDISGVLYQDDKAITGAVKVINRLHQADIPMRFVTNSSRSTKEMIYASLRKMGFMIEQSQIFTAVSAIQHTIQVRNLRPYCLVHQNILSEFSQFDQNDPNAVVITDAAEDFNYDHLNRAFDLVINGAPLLGIGKNRYFRTGDKLSLDAGPFICAIEYAANVKAEILGKPDPAFFMAAVESVNCQADEVLMIGDDVEADVIGAVKAGLHGCLVQTGKYQKGDEDLSANLGFDVAATVSDAVNFYFN